MPRRRRVRHTAEGVPMVTRPVQRATQAKDPNPNEQQSQAPQPMLFQKGAKINSELIMELQRTYGNRAVQQMLLEQNTENDSNGAPIEDAVLTLQTMPRDMGQEMIDMLELLVRMIRRLRLDKLQMKVADQQVDLRDFEEIHKSYLQAFDMRLIGSLVSGEQGKAVENYAQKDPFENLDEDIARVIMSPGHVLASMQQLTIELGGMVTGKPGQDSPMAVDRMINAPLQQLRANLDVIETVEEGKKAVQHITLALDAIYNASTHLRV